MTNRPKKPKPAPKMLEDLPESIPYGKAYKIPPEIAVDPGDAFAYICAICFEPEEILPLAKYFGVSRQTFWIWRCHGKGVPDQYRETVEALLTEVDEPLRKFRLPSRTKIDMIMRPPRGSSAVGRQPTQNYNLLDLLQRICEADEFGQTTLKTIIDMMSRPVSNPYVFYQWGWSKGGVPPSYVTSFFTVLMQLQIYRLYGFEEGNAPAWEKWAETNLIAPSDDDEGDDNEG